MRRPNAAPRSTLHALLRAVLRLLLEAVVAAAVFWGTWRTDEEEDQGVGRTKTSQETKEPEETRAEPSLGEPTVARGGRKMETSEVIKGF